MICWPGLAHRQRASNIDSHTPDQSIQVKLSSVPSRDFSHVVSVSAAGPRPAHSQMSEAEGNLHELTPDCRHVRDDLGLVLIECFAFSRRDRRFQLKRL